MRIDLPFYSGITLKLATGPADDQSYPTAKIQKGLILIYEGQELCEEAVGFGVPVLKLGLRSIFPGDLELSPLGDGYPGAIRAMFKMNLEERLRKSGSTVITNPILYGSKNIMAAFIRRLPFMRTLLTRTSSLLRSLFSWETTYEPSSSPSYVALNFFLEPQTGRIKVELDRQVLSQEGISEVIVMNEQGARHFDQYQDIDGVSLLEGEIGLWDQVSAKEATFISRKAGISFSLPQVSGSRLYRGRELIGTRLAWSGFGYTFAPSLGHFAYEIRLDRLP